MILIPYYYENEKNDFDRQSNLFPHIDAQINDRFIWHISTGIK